MHWLKCSLLVTTLCSAYCQDSVTETELTNSNAKNSSVEASKGNDKNLKSIDSTEFEPLFTIKLIRNSTTNLNKDLQDVRNITRESKEANITSDVQLNINSEQKREVTNVTFNDIKPFLLFPILPFLFPPSKTENETSENQLLNPQNNKIKVKGNPSDVKPFIFFDFAFIRRIPLNNRSNNTSDSNVINEEKLGISKVDDTKKNSQKSRRRRNTNMKLETPEYFDESLLFPDSELDEFLPKSDLFFPDLPFHHHKSLKKLSRRKRDQKKSDLKSDLNFFFDAFDEAFMRTKRELERTDPLLNFLKGAQPSFDEDKKENIFEQIPNIQEKPKMKWRIQRNIKRFKNDPQDKLRKGQDGPVIIVDKVVKIGEFHVKNEGHDKDKLKKKKRENELKKKLIGGDNLDEMNSLEKDETLPKNIFDIINQEEKRKKRSHIGKSDEQSNSKVQSKELKILHQLTVSPFNTSEVKKRHTEIDPLENESKNNKYGSLMKTIDTLKFKITQELTSNADRTAEKLKEKGPTYYKKLSSKKTSYENLKRNVTELLNQFLDLSDNSEDANLMERPEHNEHDEIGIFDWTEKETQNTNLLGKNSREKRQNKDTDFVDEYVDLSKKEKQIAELNYLILTVTLPTVFVFALVLLVCFFSLQVKGKICTKLFRPRQVYIVEDEKLMQFKKPTSQTSSKLQTI